jgi:uncharacterized protein YjbI with pentapeptide repeats
MNTSSYYSVKLDNIANRDVEVLHSLLAKETLMHFKMTDSCLSATGGLSDMESAFIDYVSNTTHQPCAHLKHFGFSNVHTDDGNLTGQSYSLVLLQGTSIQSIEFANCSLCKNGTESIAKALTCLIIGNMQVCESLQSVDLQGSVLNESFGLVCYSLVRFKHSEYVNLRDCNLTQSQKDKLQCKLGYSKRKNPPTIVLEWEDDESDNADGADQVRNQDESEFSQPGFLVDIIRILWNAYKQVESEE